MTNQWLDLGGLIVWEESKPDYHLVIEIIDSELTIENSLILGNSLIDWVEHIKGDDWINSVETVFGTNKKPYIRMKENR